MEIVGGVNLGPLRYAHMSSEDARCVYRLPATATGAKTTGLPTGALWWPGFVRIAILN